MLEFDCFEEKSALFVICKAEQTNSSKRSEARLIQIIVFLLLAFFIPLICVLLIKYTTIGRSKLFSLLIFGLEAASPSLAAILTVLLFGSGLGLRKFLKSCYIDHFALKLVLIGLFLPAVVTSVSKLIYCFCFGIAPVFWFPPAKNMLIICWALIAEELGWRGFLQDKLGAYLNECAIPFLLGIVWALWHYHFFLSGQMSVPITLFVLGCIADSYLYFALTKTAKGNIIPASVSHFSGNLFLNLFLISPQYNRGSSILYLLYVLGSLITAAIVFTAVLKGGISSRKKV